MESARSQDIPALIDLSTVAEDRRAAVWRRAAPSLFPGLAVTLIDGNGFPTGDIRRVGMGDGALWSIRSSPALVEFAPAGDAADGSASFSLLLQVEGVNTISQKGRTCRLIASDMCLLDERFAFRIDGEAVGEVVILRMPRGAVLSRNPHLEHHTAATMHGIEAGVSLLGETLLNTLHRTPFMNENQRQATLVAIVHMLGAADMSTELPTASSDWRVRAALAYIELNFAMPGLSAEQVAQAQRISRRRLDQLLGEAIGLSITGRIWARRLEQAAADLLDPQRASFTAGRIAFANGFEDAAHFTRAFKRRFGYAPAQWRMLGSAAAH